MYYLEAGFYLTSFLIEVLVFKYLSTCKKPTRVERFCSHMEVDFHTFCIMHDGYKKLMGIFLKKDCPNNGFAKLRRFYCEFRKNL
jgi:hypothetical protein